MCPACLQSEPSTVDHRSAFNAKTFPSRPIYTPEYRYVFVVCPSRGHAPLSPVARAIEECMAHAAFKDEFRQNNRSHSRRAFLLTFTVETEKEKLTNSQVLCLHKRE